MNNMIIQKLCYAILIIRLTRHVFYKQLATSPLLCEAAALIFLFILRRSILFRLKMELNDLLLSSTTLLTSLARSLSVSPT